MSTSIRDIRVIHGVAKDPPFPRNHARDSLQPVKGHKVKKQTNSTIKAHLLRGAFYLLPLWPSARFHSALAQPGSIVTGPIPSSAKADTFAINCSPTPSPTQVMDPSPTPSPTDAATPTAYPSNSHVEILPPDYQNPNNASMAWVQFGGNSSHPKPGVLVIHGSGWNGGCAYR